MSYNDQTTPAVCTSCLGPNPYVEMVRERHGLECKLCTRPFTVFKWCPIKGGLFKKTVICLTCARARNCCQACMLDLTYGIDLRTRDQLLKLADKKTILESGPKNQVSRIYAANELEKKYADQGEAGITDPEEKAAAARQLLGSLAKIERPKPTKEASNEPISKADLLKLCKNLPFNGSLVAPPKNPRARTFFLFGINDRLPEYAVRDYFSDLLGERESKKIDAVTLSHKGRIGFVEFSSRAVAENVAMQLANSQPRSQEQPRPCLVVIERCPLRVCWAGKTTGLDYGNSDLNKIRGVVKMQLVKLAEKEGGEGSAKRSRSESSVPAKRKQTTQGEQDEQKNVSLPGKTAKYRALSGDYEV